MINLDARNLSCPEPLLMLKKAIKQNKGEDICLLLSSQNALENCKRFAEKAKYTVSITKTDFGYQMDMKA